MSADQAAALDAKLAGIEQRSGHQLVVATLPSLQGQEIETYGYQLGRTWAIGKKGVNDGVILIVAPNERKVRIEVGYGLEGVLTDAYSSVVINSVILPIFKAGDYPGGIDAGVDAIAEQIALPPDQAQARIAQVTAQQQRRHSGINVGTLIWWGVIFLFFVLPMLGRLGGGRRYRGGGIGNIILWSALSGALNSRGGGSGWGGGGGFGGGGGGGFSGGGGSFGGGGASGGW